MHFVSERLKFFPSFTEFSLLAAEFWPWKLHKSMPAAFASLAALHSRLLSYHPDACFLFLLSLTYHLTLHISFPESNHRTACQIPANYEPGVVTFWQNFKGFFPLLHLSFQLYIYLCCRQNFVQFGTRILVYSLQSSHIKHSPILICSKYLHSKISKIIKYSYKINTEFFYGFSIFAFL